MRALTARQRNKRTAAANVKSAHSALTRPTRWGPLAGRTSRGFEKHHRPRREVTSAACAADMEDDEPDNEGPLLLLTGGPGREARQLVSRILMDASAAAE
ncbi:hypothetical protein MRX96_007522 [Rhipicephalus microplus]